MKVIYILESEYHHEGSYNLASWLHEPTAEDLKDYLKDSNLNLTGLEIAELVYSWTISLGGSRSLNIVELPLITNTEVTDEKET